MAKKGYKMSEEHKRKISESHKALGDKHWSHRPEVKAKLIKTLRSDNWLGKKRPDVTGKNHHLWKGDDFDRNERHRMMGQMEYRNWRKNVFERDNFTCQECETEGHYVRSAIKKLQRGDQK